MTLGYEVVDLMKSEGVEIKENHYELAKEFDLALSEGRFNIIENKGNPIGFITHDVKKDRVLINKCFVSREFRSRFSLLAMRRFFRKLYPGVQLYWKSKRRNRLCFVK